MLSSETKLLGVGFSNIVNLQHVIAILSPVSAGVKRLISVAKDGGSLIDVTSGRKARSVILFTDKTVMLSALNAQTLNSRATGMEEVKVDE
ncbi:MAG: DUF370 domain-containing protein [Clostridia bacterium]